MPITSSINDAFLDGRAVIHNELVIVMDTLHGRVKWAKEVDVGSGRVARFNIYCAEECLKSTKQYKWEITRKYKRSSPLEQAQAQKNYEQAHTLLDETIKHLEDKLKGV